MPPDPFTFVVERELGTEATAPYSDEFTIGIERELANNFSVSVSLMS